MLGRTIVVSDATATVSDEAHNAALSALFNRFADVFTTKEIVGLLAAGEPAHSDSLIRGSMPCVSTIAWNDAVGSRIVNACDMRFAMAAAKWLPRMKTPKLEGRPCTGPSLSITPSGTAEAIAVRHRA